MQGMESLVEIQPLADRIVDRPSLAPYSGMSNAADDKMATVRDLPFSQCSGNVVLCFVHTALRPAAARHPHTSVQI